MPITEQDIKLLKSARLSDTPDGGGAMTGNVVLSGQDNNLFDDVSNLDRVYGAVSLRKVFAAVLTNDTDKYLGARVIIDKPPADPYVEGTLFAASSLFDVRAAAQQRVEAYLAPGTPYQGLLYGPHIVGMRVVSLVQQVDRPIPGIGQVYILRKGLGTSNEVDQFVRVTGVTHSTLTFTDTVGNFVRRVVVCDISDSLRHDFIGWEAVRVDAELDYSGKTRIFNSVVADAAAYYGIRPLETAAAVGDFAVKADSSYTQLLPSAQIETPIADASATGYTRAAEAVGGVLVYEVQAALTLTQKLFIGASVGRSSLSLSCSTWTTPLTDNGAGVLVSGGVPVGAVDYENGVVTLSNGSYAANTTITVSYKLASTPLLALRSLGLYVTLENRSLSYVRTLNSTPAKGTLTVSYMVSGQWCLLRDNGAGSVVADDAGFGAGNINYVTSTLTLTLGALPDVGGTIVVQWGEADAAKSIAQTDLGSEALTQARLFFEVQLPATAVPNTGVRITSGPVPGNHSMTAQLTNGVSSGQALIEPQNQSGQTGTLRVYPQQLFVIGTTYDVEYRASAASTVAVQNIATFSLGGPVSPGSLRIAGVSVAVTYTLSGTVYGKEPYFDNIDPLANPEWTFTDTRSVRLDASLTLTDKGDGTVQASYYVPGAFVTQNVTVGSVNYGTGDVTLSASTSLAGGAAGPNVWVANDHDTNGPWYRQPWSQLQSSNRSVVITIATQSGSATFTQPGGTPATLTVTPAAYQLRPNITVPQGRQLKGLVFTLPAEYYVDAAQCLQDAFDPTKLVANINPLTGLGTTVGTVGTNGEVALTAVPAAPWPRNNAISGFGATLVPTATDAAQNNAFTASEVVFRTPTAPLRPGGFSVVGTLANGDTFNAVADANGKIDTPDIAGVVNYQTGVCNLWAKETRSTFQTPALNISLTGSSGGSSGGYGGGGQYYAQVLGYDTIQRSLGGFRLGTLRYNAVAFTYLPLDAAILGLDPVRLPSDGRVPIFKSGRVVVVHNTQSLPPRTVTANQTVNCGRTLLARVRVFGADGLEVTTGFTRNLDAGTVTFTNVAGVSQPVTIEHRIEDEALCADAQITGDLRITRPLTHAYPAGTSYVSSAYIKGTLQAATEASFAQSTWVNAWADTPVGTPLLAQYNDTDNPLLVTNAGAITERWACIFTSSASFNLVGEELGVVLTGSTATPLAPVNPATGVPYFTLSPAGWGGGWAAGNVLRFNTAGANFPLWVARTVRQSPTAPPGTDQLTISVRGDIDQ